ncbi:MAG: ferritin-like domain-containing protein [Spongiibacter sp.]|uniref:Ferritin/DPS domain-containing protein n=1 Tax=Spongiibacter thalassae TaxID=2721624 RepID=A0ABX1GCW0_9GAMM|nr:ferritin-like domain-containing protein [Spongiibacter thalassae]MDX1504154.1 ferritin-like domain-containing protein [Spongiibacter sp.]NKI16323.1 hypothetical protein [Spongiibacter thalassae]
MELHYANNDSNALPQLSSLLYLLHQSTEQCTYMFTVAAEPLAGRLAKLRKTHLRHINELAEVVRILGGEPVKLPRDKFCAMDEVKDFHVAERMLLPFCQQEQEIIERCKDQIALYYGRNDHLVALLSAIRDETREQIIDLFQRRH